MKQHKNNKTNTLVRSQKRQKKKRRWGSSTKEEENDEKEDDGDDDDDVKVDDRQGRYSILSNLISLTNHSLTNHIHCIIIIIIDI